MEPFTTVTGKYVAIGLSNVDTDQIIPKQFLKRIERTGYGQFLFYDWRFTSSGEKTDFVLNHPESDGASILVAGENFGCGSSREHAAWSLLDHGFRAVIAPSFAEIFYSNSLKNGLLPVVLDHGFVADLISADPDARRITVDLESQTVSVSTGRSAHFEIDPFHKHCLLNGMDEIALTLQFENEISQYEADSLKSPPFLSIAR